MIEYVIRRLLISIVLAFALVAVIFFMLRTVVPGDPAEVMAGENAPPAVVEQIRHNMGLDQPLLVQFWFFIKNTFHGDLGNSTQTREPVTKRVFDAMPVTFRLTLYCFLYTMVLGIFTAAYPDCDRSLDAHFLAGADANPDLCRLPGSLACIWQH
jgi:peptide/nickel transport system permease protein